MSVDTVPGHIEIRLRIFNEQSESIRIIPDTIWLALGYAPEPIGPHIPVEGLVPFDLLPGQAADLTLHWAWSSEPYGSLSIGLYQFAIVLK